MMQSFLNKWGQIVANSKSRWFISIIWVVIIAIFSISWPSVNKEVVGSNNLLPDDVMSIEANKIMNEQFPNHAGVPLLVVWQRDGGLQEADFETIQSLYKVLGEKPLAYQSEIPPFDQMPAQALAAASSEDGEAIVTPIFFSKRAETDQLKDAVSNLNKMVDGISDQSELQVQYTGPVSIQIDAVSLFSQADVKLLIATVVIVLVLLIALYRSPILAFIPLIAVAFAYGLINPLLGLMASKGWIEVDAQAVSIMTVLLFGAGTDYCLFLISRYRDELLLVENQYTALRRAMSKTGGAIMMSAMTTVLGLFTLSLAHYASYHRFAVPFSLAIFVMAIALMTILPALLALFGRVAFYPFIPRTEEMRRELEKKKGKKLRDSKGKSRLRTMTGELVTKKPIPIIVVCMILLGGLALFVPKIEYTYGLLDSFPEDMPSREGYTLISEHYAAGEVAPMYVILETVGKSDVDLKEKLAALPYVSAVSDGKIGESNENILSYEVTLAIDPYSQEAVDHVPAIKSLAKDSMKEADISKGEVWIGGETATLYDTQKTTNRDQNIIMPVVLGIMALLLVLYFRSLPAMLYMLTTVVFSFLSALGIGWIVIHYILGEPAMQGLIPLYSFVFLVALGSDYNIFMMSSIWRKRKTLPHKQAISEGVGETGYVISSAGLILAGTFAVLAVLPMQVLVQFGTITAIGILLDTFIIRPLFVPAITTVLGKYAFWPGKLWRKQDNTVMSEKE
ncbi:MMPL family transporter [Virgibacillus soli]|uniref:MMPL family transporter n=2 Tax=Paracerasibacillus soli TaxID=480284 RepID=A0ABU5CNK5_9BACI|nr:MMPL family transporter [Virgibacillus soli]MDY0407938.1 MMPL family transporter [Virgibacillus soli]